MLLTTVRSSSLGALFHVLHEDGDEEDLDEDEARPYLSHLVIRRTRRP